MRLPQLRSHGPLHSSAVLLSNELWPCDAGGEPLLICSASRVMRQGVQRGERQVKREATKLYSEYVGRERVQPLTAHK